METENSNSSFFGSGWGFPPKFLENGAEVQMVSKEEDIEQSLQILLSTSLNERSMSPDFGSDMDRFKFEELDQGLINSIETIIRDAIYYHEPRIKLDELEINVDINQVGLLFISVKYTIKSTNSRYNMVWPYYLNEAVVTVI